MSADLPRDDFVVTVYQGQEVGVFSDPRFDDDDEEEDVPAPGERQVDIQERDVHVRRERVVEAALGVGEGGNGELKIGTVVAKAPPREHNPDAAQGRPVWWLPGMDDAASFLRGYRGPLRWEAA